MPTYSNHRTIHLECCPLCDHGDQNPGAWAVHSTYHAKHRHADIWHTHMVYGPHTHTRDADA